MGQSLLGETLQIRPFRMWFGSYLVFSEQILINFSIIPKINLNKIDQVTFFLEEPN